MPNKGEQSSTTEMDTSEPTIVEPRDTTAPIVEPRWTDIFCGRGLLGRVNEGEGNKQFQKLIRSMRHLYDSAPSARHKSGLSKLVVELIEADGCRFVYLDHATEEWRELEHKKRVAKVAQSFRDLRAKGKKLPTSLRRKKHGPSRLCSEATVQLVGSGQEPSQQADESRTGNAGNGERRQDLQAVTMLAKKLAGRQATRLLNGSIPPREHDPTRTCELKRVPASHPTTTNRPARKDESRSRGKQPARANLPCLLPDETPSNASVLDAAKANSVPKNPVNKNSHLGSATVPSRKKVCEREFSFRSSSNVPECFKDYENERDATVPPPPELVPFNSLVCIGDLVSPSWNFGAVAQCLEHAVEMPRDAM